MWGNVLEWVGEIHLLEVCTSYGLFPLGIVVGILIMKWSFSKQFEYSESEKKALREEKKELLETITALHDRIDKLHKNNQVKPINGRRQR